MYLKFSYTEILDITIFHDNFTDEIFDVVERERKRKRERKERKKKKKENTIEIINVDLFCPSTN